MKAPLLRRLVLGVALLSPLVGVLGTRLWAREVQGELPRPPFREGGPAELLAELRRERAIGLVQPPGEGADAAPLLNRLAGTDVDPARGEAWWAKRDAFDASWSRARGTAWLEQPEVTGPLDTSDLATLRGFDHWAWRESPPFVSSPGAPPTCPISDPQPSALGLRTLARARLAQAVEAGDLGPALEEVHHLARLLDSTDTLASAMFANALRGDELAAVEAARARGQSPPAPAWTADDVRARSEALRALVALISTDADPEVGREFGEEGAALPGVCAALNEAAVFGLPARSAVEDPWPGELDQGAGIRRVTAMLRAGRCPLASVRQRWEDPATRQVCLATPGLEVPPSLVLEVPWLRSPFAAYLVAGLSWGHPGRWGEADADPPMRPVPPS